VRLWRNWECNIKVDLKEVGCEVVDGIYLAQYKVLLNLRLNYTFLKGTVEFIAFNLFS
jgi:hypothetical protein